MTTFIRFVRALVLVAFIYFALYIADASRGLIGIAMFCLGVWVFWYTGHDFSIEDDDQSPMFAGKEVTVVQSDGAKTRGKMHSEPEDCNGYIILIDAQEIEDGDGNTIEDGTIYDMMAIPIEFTAAIRIENLDKAPSH